MKIFKILNFSIIISLLIIIVLLIIEKRELKTDNIETIKISIKTENNVNSMFFNGQILSENMLQNFPKDSILECKMPFIDSKSQFDYINKFLKMGFKNISINRWTPPTFYINKEGKIFSDIINGQQQELSLHYLKGLRNLKSVVIIQDEPLKNDRYIKFFNNLGYKNFTIYDKNGKKLFFYDTSTFQSTIFLDKDTWQLNGEDFSENSIELIKKLNSAIDGKLFLRVADNVTPVIVAQALEKCKSLGVKRITICY